MERIVLTKKKSTWTFTIKKSLVFESIEIIEGKDLMDIYFEILCKKKIKDVHLPNYFSPVFNGRPEYNKSTNIHTLTLLLNNIPEWLCKDDEYYVRAHSHTLTDFEIAVTLSVE